jgi:AcrR family transcriptional regulator
MMVEERYCFVKESQMPHAGSKMSSKPSDGELRLLRGLLVDVQADAAKRLIVAAVGAFAARGYHATTTRDISVAAGMSASAMYVHYPSKEDLLFETLKIAHEAARQAISESAEGVTAADERLRAIVRDFTLWHADHASLARVAQYELEALSPQHHVVIANIRRRTESVVRSEIQLGLEQRVFRVQDVTISTRAILSMGIDVSRWFRAGGTLTSTLLADHYAELAVRMVGSEPCRDQ